MHSNNSVRTTEIYLNCPSGRHACAASRNGCPDLGFPKIFMVALIDRSRPVSDRRVWRSRPARAGLHLSLLRDLERVVDLDPEVSDGALRSHAQLAVDSKIEQREFPGSMI